MREASPLQALLSLFTDADCAESIAGDLTEEREVRGTAWFWFHGLRTTVALFANGVASAPRTTAALMAFGVGLFVTLAFAALAVVFWFPIIGSHATWTLLTVFWCCAAMWTGVSLVRVSPKHGMTACLALALGSEFLLVLYPIFVAWTDQPSILRYANALVPAVPLLAGAAMARRRTAAEVSAE